jgi:hypothetical protein
VGQNSALSRMFNRSQVKHARGHAEHGLGLRGLAVACVGLLDCVILGAQHCSHQLHTVAVWRLRCVENGFINRDNSHVTLVRLCAVRLATHQATPLP